MKIKYNLTINISDNEEKDQSYTCYSIQEAIELAKLHYPSWQSMVVVFSRPAED